MFPFDVILFDVGGVLLTNGWDHRERSAVLSQFGLDRAAFETRNPDPHRAWERGEIPLEAYLKATVFFEPRSFTPMEFFSAMCAQSEPLADGALGILRQIAASDRCMLGALNNESRELNEYRFKQFGLRNYFHVALTSCYLGLRKPDQAIYGRALEILGRPPERILFVDDRPENVRAAAEAGLQAIRFEGADPLWRQLESMGIL